MDLKWYRRFAKLAKEVGSWSKDDSTKVGAVVIGPVNREIRTVGYNGFPRKFDDSIVEYKERPLKYFYTEHAERNAIYNATRIGVSLDDCWMFSTHFPCPDCTRGIIQSGISRLVCGEDRSDAGISFVRRNYDSFIHSLEMMDGTGLIVVMISENESKLIKPDKKYFENFNKIEP
jgi:dCMP deaminase